MMKNRQHAILLAGLALVLAGLACGPNLPGGGTDSADENGQDDAAPIVGGETAGGDEAALDYRGVDVSGLNSYRSLFTMSFSGTDEAGAPVNGTYTVNQILFRRPSGDSCEVGDERYWLWPWHL